jgi:CheY-like chemotaxis protein
MSSGRVQETSIIFDKQSNTCMSSINLLHKNSPRRNDLNIVTDSLDQEMNSFVTIKNYNDDESFTKKYICSSLSKTSPTDETYSNDSLNISFYDTITLSILIVDDSASTRRMVSRMLHSKGYICHEAEDGTIAINLAREQEYDLILMDFVMPNMNGLEATKIIRNQGFKGLIYGLTGNGLPQDIEKFIEHGANRVFIKPLDMKRFQKAVEGNY